VLRWFLRVALLFFVVVFLFRWLFRLLGRAAPPPAPRETKAGTMKRDPVCGMFVVAETSLSERAEGESFYFCSERCRERFRAERRALHAPPTAGQAGSGR
jgi:YHS domain-containing protein